MLDWLRQVLVHRHETASLVDSMILLLSLDVHHHVLKGLIIFFFVLFVPVPMPVLDTLSNTAARPYLQRLLTFIDNLCAFCHFLQAMVMPLLLMLFLLNIITFTFTFILRC